MTEKETNKLKKINRSAKSSEVPANQQQQIVENELITLQGYTTSQIRTREKLSNTPAYCFLKTDESKTDIPVIFRIKEKSRKYPLWELYSYIKPPIKKGSYLEVQGHYSSSDKSDRKSFTAYTYQLLDAFSPKAKTVSKPIERRYF